MVHCNADCGKEKWKEEESSYVVRQEMGLVVVAWDKVEGMVGVVVDQVRESKDGQEYMVK